MIKVTKTFDGLNGKILDEVRYTPDGIILVFDNGGDGQIALMLSATDCEHGREPYIIFQQDERCVQTWLNK